MNQKSEILIYQSKDGVTKVDVKMENETVWLSINQMTELFQTTKQNISLHIQNIYDEGELQPEATVKEYLTVQKEGPRNVKRALRFYNLDVIISVGYRVKSHVGTHFRIWATRRLREYIIKGMEWILYMLAGIEETSLQTIQQIHGIKKLMLQHKQKLRGELPKIYSQDLLNNIFRHPYTKIDFVMADLNVTRITATRYLDELSRVGLLNKQKLGRDNYYINTDLYNLLGNVNNGKQ